MIWIWLFLFLALYLLSMMFLYRLTDTSDRKNLDIFSIICTYSPFCIVVASLLILFVILLVLTEVIIDNYVYIKNRIRKWILIKRKIIIISEQDPYGEELWEKN
jgi:4-hydroxybenzoate polyprenyltransferase